MNRRRWTLAALLIGLSLVCVLSVRIRAANPTSGTIMPSSGALHWTGTAVGGTSPEGEATCVDGVNCDTFTLTVAGTPAQWAGKRIEVRVSWVLLASDYDFYIHKDSNAGPVVDEGASPPPGTQETASLGPDDLDADGTTVFTVHVVYFAAPPGDQYTGEARVITDSGGGSPTPAPSVPPKSDQWTINYHGTCCEGNLAAAGDNTYVLLPVLVNGNKIRRSTDGGQTWQETYPPAPASVPFGIEGDMQAFGNDVIYFGTELATAVVARSEQAGATDSWMVTQDPLLSAGNDQAWSYLAPYGGLRPAGALPGDKPYTLAGWMRIGSAIAFSFDGGTTFTAQTPLVGNNGSGPEHIVCHQNATLPPLVDPGDTRVPHSLFRNWKGGRHGTWGTDQKFYWTEVVQDPAGDLLYVCSTSDFGVNWTGTKHPLAPGPGSDFVVNHSVFDSNGTLYILHGNKLYVSFNQGKTIAFTHTLPRYGTAGRSDAGSDQYFAVDCGTVHIALLEDAPGGDGRVFYLRATGADTASPVWQEELVDEVGNVRLDFMYIVLDGNGVPTISYTTPGQEVTTASRKDPMSRIQISSCDVQPLTAVSRKTHGNGFVGDINLLAEIPAVEPRSGPTHQIVLTFATPQTVASAEVSSGNGEVSGVQGSGTTEITINLSNVANAQVIEVTLFSAPGLRLVGIPMAVLEGDVNSSRIVTGADVNLAKGQQSQFAAASNFRADVNASGVITGADVNIIKQRQSTFVP